MYESRGKRHQEVCTLREMKMNAIHGAPEEGGTMEVNGISGCILWGDRTKQLPGVPWGKHARLMASMGACCGGREHETTFWGHRGGKKRGKRHQGGFQTIRNKTPSEPRTK